MLFQIFKWGFRENIFEIHIFYQKRHSTWNFSEICLLLFYIYSAKIVNRINRLNIEKKKESDGKWKTKKLLSFDWSVFQTRGQSFSGHRKRNFRAMKIKEQIARMLPRKQNRVLERIHSFSFTIKKRKKETKFSSKFQKWKSKQYWSKHLLL